MAYSEKLAERVHAILDDEPRLVERKMFGGIAFMLRGNMCCGVVGEDLMVRVGPEGYEAALARPQAREMDFTGRPMRGMVYVAAAGLQSKRALKSWVDRGAAYALSLPAK